MASVKIQVSEFVEFIAFIEFVELGLHEKKPGSPGIPMPGGLATTRLETGDWLLVTEFTKETYHENRSIYSPLPKSSF